MWPLAALTRRTWLLAALLLCAAPALCGAKPRIVVVFATHPPRYPLVAAGRETWRKDVPTLVVTEGDTERAIASPLGNSSFETWWEFPDDLRKDQGIWKKGDMKLAASFRIANETFGDTYECVRSALALSGAVCLTRGSALAAGWRMETTIRCGSCLRRTRWCQALTPTCRTSLRTW
jgi:hypothetical protein